MEQPKILLGINYYSGKNNERAKYLNKFLKSIYKHTTEYPEHDIFIFDDNSPYFPLTCERILKAETPGVRWHRVRNRIHKYFLEHPEYKYLMAFDEDYEVVVPNWMNHIVSCMENIPEIGILGSHWARLADGTTRQQQHSPDGKLSGGGFEVFTNRFVTGGCWTLRREVVKMYPDEGDSDFVGYDGGKPGADTFYGFRMMKETPFKLCTTMTDLVMHRGQEFMTGKFANKYNSAEFQAGERLY
jgi:cellulose synthase/poly-beta-1,6-N-acetylglucosamine synthase-like glycosyltransferase